MTTINVHFDVASADELRDVLEKLGHMASGVQTLRQGGEGREGLALYGDDELVVELERRRTASGQTELVLEQAKAKPGRKPKLQAVVPPPVEPDPQPAKEAANEPAPDPKAVAQAKPTEPSTDNPIAPETLTEADMLKLMQELYAESGDLTMVRGLAEEVCGKPQMSEVKPELYPQLKKRIEEELERVRTEKKAAGAA
ncbi:MAG: hypothetical protein ABW051_09745 [Burkholderiaceae bacterium]